jgi:transcriptional regulator GlxA family with amidase domain
MEDAAMRVAILAPPGVQSLDVVGPLEVFWDAARQLGDPTAYEVEVLGTRAGPILGTGGLRILPDCTIDDPDQPIDTLLVGGDPRIGPVEPKVAAWLRRRAPSIRRYGSVCTGAFLLGAAGLLDGRRVTTHWECAARLQAEHPSAAVDADQIFIRDGALSTTAGVTAGMDLALALVEEDHGRDLALAVARYMVMYLKRPGGQSQFSSHLAAQLSERPVVQRVQDHVLANLNDDLSVEALATRAGMSPRNFSRVFRKETGTTPAGFVESARLEAARRMLEDSTTSLQRIAWQCGFGTVDGMRRAFIRNLGVGPHDYRQRFRSAWTAAPQQRSKDRAVQNASTAPASVLPSPRSSETATDRTTVPAASR